MSILQKLCYKSTLLLLFLWAVCNSHLAVKKKWQSLLKVTDFNKNLCFLVLSSDLFLLSVSL